VLSGKAHLPSWPKGSATPEKEKGNSYGKKIAVTQGLTERLEEVMGFNSSEIFHAHFPGPKAIAALRIRRDRTPPVVFTNAPFSGKLLPASTVSEGQAEYAVA
jgi:hypothetical protein